MLDSIIADTACFDVTLVDGILDGPPAVEPGLSASVGTMEQEQIDVTKPTLLDRLLDGFPGSGVGAVGCKLRCEENIFSFQRACIVFAVQKGQNT